MAQDAPLPRGDRITLRALCEQLGWHPARLAIALGLVGIGLLVTIELALGRIGLDGRVAAPDVVGLTWIAIVHVVITAYLVGAWIAAQQATDRHVAALVPIGASAALTPADRETRRKALWIVTVLGLSAAFLITLASPGNVFFFDPAGWSPETAWHRVLSLAMGVLTFRLATVVTLDAMRFWRIADEIPAIDLLDLSCLAPFSRHGQTNALLFLGYVSVYSLFLVDLRYLAVFGQISLVAIAGVVVAFALPMMGARRLIQRSKARELDFVRQRIRAARHGIEAGVPLSERDRLDELTAWEARIAGVREWPFDASALARLAFYLLIPLGSWAGAAIVERSIDALLD